MDSSVAMDPGMSTEQAQGLIAIIAGLGLIGALIGLALGIVGIIAQWKIFSKAGQPGWGVFVPIYNLVLMCRVAAKPGWYWLLMIIPIYGWFVVPIILVARTARAFGKGIGFTLGLLFLGPIFWWILGFGSAQYIGIEE